MENFTFNNKTELIFGIDVENRIPELIKKYGGKKVLLHFSNSAEKTGLLGKIKEILTTGKIRFIEFGGVVSNPRLSLVLEGIELCKKEKIDFILAIGGGSAIDSSKAIAFGVFEPKIWQIYMKRGDIKRALPVGCVLTIPAAGSETSPSSVITDEKTGHKRSVNSDNIRCKFAIVNPESCKTVPDFHLASGIVDMLTHCFERYFSLTKDTKLTNAMGEAVMRTIIEEGQIVMKDRNNGEALAEIVLCGTMAHNDIIGIGRKQDWASHSIEHELSAKYDITHGSGLAIVFPAWFNFVKMHGNKEQLKVLKRFEKNVISIKNLKKFYKSIGMPLSLKDLSIFPTEFDIQSMSQKAIINRGTLGQFYTLGEKEIYEILKSCV
ncbi:MAG: iron-containing alcohol dehydrogenase [Christensenellaceae bacterium]|jgi:alcohol dehydrogenase YqhD (iron-dependent ADH family)|nr:iron-containing alcohol dehydrogenase [Christensenellaceae bacterium]